VKRAAPNRRDLNPPGADRIEQPLPNLFTLSLLVESLRPRLVEPLRLPLVLDTRHTSSSWSACAR
jgi:hypothetical protein